MSEFEYKIQKQFIVYFSTALLREVQCVHNNSNNNKIRLGQKRTEFKRLIQIIFHSRLEHVQQIGVWAIPSRGGKGGKVGSWIIPINFPPRTEQMKRMTMPNRFPPGKHSRPVMDQTTPNSRANRHAAYTQPHSLTTSDSLLHILCSWFVLQKC